MEIKLRLKKFSHDMNQIPYTNDVYGVSMINVLGHTEAPGILQVTTAKAVGSRMGAAGPAGLAGLLENVQCEGGEGTGTTTLSLSATSPSHS